jgi:hypothetical protein
MWREPLTPTSPREERGEGAMVNRRSAQPKLIML